MHKFHCNHNPFIGNRKILKKLTKIDKICIFLIKVLTSPGILIPGGTELAIITPDPEIQATRNTSYLTASKSLNGRKIARMAPMLTIFGP